MYDVTVNLLTNNELYKPFFIYLSWMTMHYVAAHIYSEFCINWSITGYLFSPITVTSPLCKGLSWIIYESSNSLSGIFVFVGSTITIYLSKLKIN